MDAEFAPRVAVNIARFAINLKMNLYFHLLCNVIRCTITTAERARIENCIGESIGENDKPIKEKTDSAIVNLRDSILLRLSLSSRIGWLGCLAGLDKSKYVVFMANNI